MAVASSVKSGYRIIEITTENTGLSKYRLLTVSEREKERKRERERESESESEREMLWSL